MGAAGRFVRRRRGSGLVLAARPRRDLRRFFVAVEGARAEPAYFDALVARGVVARGRVEVVVLPPEDADGSESNVVQVLARLDGLGPGYEPEVDERWLVADRDPGSNEPDQMAAVAQESSQKGIELAISNPCFEVWIVAHADGDESYEAEDARTWKARARAVCPGYAGDGADKGWLSLESARRAIGRMVALRGDVSERWPNTVRSDVDRLVSRLVAFAPAVV